jgi:hypothetical protein
MQLLYISKSQRLPLSHGPISYACWVSELLHHAQIVAIALIIKLSRGSHSDSYSPASALQGSQTDKVDLFLRRLGQADQSESNANAPAMAENAAISPTKRGLPFLESPTSPYFGIRLLDGDPQPDAERDGDDHSQPQQSFSIFQGKIISGQTHLDRFHESTLDAPRMSAGKIHPLDELNFSQVSCLFEEYRSMVDYLYPIVNVARLTQLAETIFVGGSEKSSKTSYEPYAVVDNVEVAIFKVLLTIVLPDQNKQKNDLASRLHQSVREEVGHMVWNSEVNLNGITLLLLVVRLYPHVRVSNQWLTDV